MFKKYIYLVFIFMNIFASAQTLPAFTVTATKVNDETCASNGAIRWTTANTAPGSVITYKIINTANNSTVAALSGTTYTSLVAGTYKIEATQTSGTLSNKAVSDIITILNQKKVLSATAIVNSDEICWNDGQFTITPNGTSPFQYQLLDASLNVIATQSTNVFTGLSAGQKYYRVIDACGQGVAGNVTIASKPSSVSRVFLEYSGDVSLDCSTITYQYFSIVTGINNNLKFPVTVEISYTNPTTNQQESRSNTYNNTNGGTANANTEKYYRVGPLSLPFFSNVSELPSTVKLTDGCGKVYTFPYSFNYRFTPYIKTDNNAQCGVYASFEGSFSTGNLAKPYIKVNYISGGPANFDPSAYDSAYGEFATVHNWGNSTKALPAGTYTVEIEDSCGRKITRTFTISAPADNFRTDQLASCTTGLGGVRVFFLNGEFSKAVLTNAPAAYTANSLPYDFTSSISSLNPSSDPTKKYFFYFEDLPPGTYTYKYTNTCDSIEKIRNFTIVGTKNNSTITSSISCGTVDYVLNSDFAPQNIYSSQTVLIQKYYPGTNDWSSPASYIPPTSVNPYPGSWYGNTASVKNLTSGAYRFVLRSSSSLNNVKTIDCYKIMQTFNIANLALDNAYAFKCGNGTFDVIISASKGSEKGLTYSIVSDLTSSATVTINNVSNPIFHGLPVGTYYFRVSDNCGNFLTRKLDIAALGQPGIRTVFDCSTTPTSVKLVVDGLENLSYEWTKEGSPTVLSTTNVLDLGTYDASEAGKYFVRVYTTNSAYCIDKIYETNISADALANPKSGLAVQPQPALLSYDGSVFNVDLFKYLQPGTYDGFGTWTEVSTPASNTLDGNNWNIYAAKDGVYTFRYTIKSPCGTTVNFTDIKLKLSKLCYKYPVKTGAIEETKFGITSLARAGKDRDNWPMVRKGGWMALESNTKGFVPNRVEFNSSNQPIGIPASNYVEGMMVYDTTNKCLKIYNGTAWACYTNPACPD